jgi:outer membrane receptor for ferrienterochelin and colicin
MSLFMATCLSAQSQNFTISGYVRDAENQESLVGSTVLNIVDNKGTASNPYGFYSISLPKGNVSLQYSYLGYKSVVVGFALDKDTVVQVLLEPLATQLDEVVIQNSLSNPGNRRLGLITVPVSQLSDIPVLLGEADVMKSLQLLPGIQSSAEGKSDFSVRGGDPDQNLVLLDGIPVYNTNHVFGFFSIFNSDAIKSVNFYKSGFPARFGGRLSSVVDVRTKDGDMEHLGGSVTAGLIAIKATLEGPLKKDRTSFYLSFRRTYIDLFMDEIVEGIKNAGDENGVPEENKYNFYFYDINAKLNHRFSSKSSLFFMLYNGSDKMTAQYANKEGDKGELNALTSQDWKWGSSIVATKWNYILSGNLFLNTTLSYNHYRYETGLAKNYSLVDTTGVESKSFAKIDYNSGINDFSLMSDLDFILSPQHYIRTGMAYIYHQFNPEVVSLKNSEGYSSNNNEHVNASEIALYAEDDWNILPALKLNFGLRLSLFNVQQKTYTNVDPRLSLSYLPFPKISIKAGYAKMKQYIHLLSSNSLFLQTDLWVPVTKNIRPMNADQYSAGIFYSLSYGMELSVEGYYKTMENLIEYKDGSSFMGTSTGWENKVEEGRGRSYGVELFVKKSTGRTTGWLSYTLSKTERKFEIINYGEWFPAKYDRRHNLSVTVNQKLSQKLELSGSWIYSSGNVITVPMMDVPAADIPQNPYPGSVVFEQIDHRNNYRMAAYHRMDAGLSYYTKKNKSRYGIWNFSVYNVYNRKNPFLLSTDFEAFGESNRKVLKQVTLFPIIPSISYTYKF